MAPKESPFPSIPTTPIRFFLYTLKPYWVLVTCSVIIVTTAAGLSQGTSYFFKLIIDAVERSDLDAALFWGLMFPVAVFIVQCLYRLSGYLGGHLITRTKQKVYDDLSVYILRHSHTFFTDRFAGSILSKINNTVSSVDYMIPEMLWTHWTSFVAFAVTFVLMVRIDLVTAYLFLGLLVMLVVVNKMMAPHKKILSREFAAANTTWRGYLADVLGNMATVRQYARAPFEQHTMNMLTADVARKNYASWRYTELMLLTNSAILFVFGLGMFWSLTHQWALGNLTTGDFVLVLALVSQITGTLLFIGRSFNATAKAFGEIEEGLTDLIVPHEIVDTPHAELLEATEGDIVWKDVTFTYGSVGVFNNFNLTIQPGQRVGLVGASGAGKTTFVSLLLRQHDIQNGSIEIGGQDIAHVTQESLREQIALVPQEPILFHRSIRDNIKYGSLNATDSEVEEVAKKAQAHGFITALAKGYDTLVGERGVKLSGGQRQRIAIARAMLKNAPILILDEATSALDSESEVAIQRALHELMVGKTVVAIAHRLSTLREMDRIIVLDSGVIVEDGTHDALVKYGGIYARLWEHQAGGFLQE
jgi:ATP-binding cassette subfamily B protein